MNVVFSTTRQWNPGDEAILAGVRRVLDHVLQPRPSGDAEDLGHDLPPAYNAILYNRHPDLRSCWAGTQLFRRTRVPGDFWQTETGRVLQANLQVGMFDNSLKPGTDGGWIDLVVLAGTPEWCSGKMEDLFEIVLQGGVPVLIVGVGGGCDVASERYRPIIAQAALRTVRDSDTRDAMARHGWSAELLPCPALLCVGDDEVKRVWGERPRVGLIYQASSEESVVWSGIMAEQHRCLVETYREIVRRFSSRWDLELVCHYVDEIPLAKRDFPDLPVRYSFDWVDYPGLYRRYDAVVGTRVHGIGMAAAVGVPGVALTHDTRGSTCDGFLAERLEVTAPPGRVAGCLERTVSQSCTLSARLAEHKRVTFDRYVRLVGGALPAPRVAYPQESSPRPAVPSFSSLAALEPALREASEGRPPITATQSREMLDRLVNIELKVNELLRRDP